MKDLTQGSVVKLIFWFTMPMLLGNVFQQLYQIIDGVVVGHWLGKEALAAIGASMPIIFLLVSLMIGVSIGNTVVISQFFGAKNLSKVKKAVDTMYISFFCASILLTSIGIWFSHDIFRLIRLPADLIEPASIFINMYLLGLTFAFLFNGTSAALRGMGDSTTPLYFLIGMTLTNIVLVFVFVVWFDWGIAGAGLSTAVSQVLAFVAAIIYLNRRHPVLHFSLRALQFDWGIFLKSLQIGLPTGLQQTFVALGGMAVYSIVNGYGTDVIAGYAAGLRIDSFATLPAMNFAMALSTFVGQNLGAKKIERVLAGLKATWWMSSVTSIVISAIVIVFGNPLLHMFTDDVRVIAIGHEYLIIVGACYILFSTMFTFNAVTRGAGATLVPMFITLAALWLVRVPCAYFLSNTLGEEGVWWSIAPAWLFGSVGALLYFRSGRWKTKKVA